MIRSRHACRALAFFERVLSQTTARLLLSASGEHEGVVEVRFLIRPAERDELRQQLLELTRLIGGLDAGGGENG